MAYQPTGFVWDAAERKGLKVKIYVEYVEYAGVTYKNPYNGSTREPSWVQFYQDALAYESGADSSSMRAPGERFLFGAGAGTQRSAPARAASTRCPGSGAGRPN